jgi:hypothetical protein
MFIEQPPVGDFSPEATAYLNRVFSIFDTEISNSKSVSVVEVLPERFRSGRIYYVKENPLDATAEGFYVNIGDVWNRVNLEPV